MNNLGGRGSGRSNLGGSSSSVGSNPGPSGGGGGSGSSALAGQANNRDDRESAAPTVPISAPLPNVPSSSLTFPETDTEKLANYLLQYKGKVFKDLDFYQKYSLDYKRDGILERAKPEDAAELASLRMYTTFQCVVTDNTFAGLERRNDYEGMGKIRVNDSLISRVRVLNKNYSGSSIDLGIRKREYAKLKNDARIRIFGY